MRASSGAAAPPWSTYGARSQFRSDDAVYKILYLAICDIETRDKSRGGGAKKSILSRGSVTHGWTAALNKFAILFPAGSQPLSNYPSQTIEQSVYITNLTRWLRRPLSASSSVSERRSLSPAFHCRADPPTLVQLERQRLATRPEPAA